MVVMLAHYIISFNAFSGGYGGLPKIEGGVFDFASGLLGFGMPGFSYGAFGVALFFFSKRFCYTIITNKINHSAIWNTCLHSFQGFKDMASIYNRFYYIITVQVAFISWFRTKRHLQHT